MKVSNVGGRSFQRRTAQLETRGRLRKEHTEQDQPSKIHRTWLARHQEM